MTAETEIYSTPSLPDKAPGIYETLGPNEMLLPIVRAANRTAAAASDIAADFAGLLIDPDLHDLQPVIRMSWISNSLNHLCEYVGNLLACMDIVIAASGYSTSPADRAEDVRRSYYLQYVLLLREAEQKGLPPDYTSAPMQEARRRDCGLRRPDIAKGGNKNT